MEVLPQIIFVATIIALAVILIYDYKSVYAYTTRFIDWVRAFPFESAITIILIYIVLVIIAMPIMYLSIALGFAYTRAFDHAITGYFFGLFFISIGIILGGIVALLLSRYLFSKIIKRTCLSRHKSFLAIDAVITNEGWKTVFLLRMTPVPYAVISYLLGITGIKLKDYAIGSLSVIIHICLWLYIGKTLEKLSEITKKDTSNDNTLMEYGVICVEIFIAFTVGIIISYKAKAYLD